MSIFENMLSRYQIATQDDLGNATHEVMQKITLAKTSFTPHSKTKQPQ
jgi:hypothetical protein